MNIDITTQHGVEVSASETFWSLYVPFTGETKTGRISDGKTIGLRDAVMKAGEATALDAPRESYDLARLYVHMEGVIDFKDSPEVPAYATDTDVAFAGAALLLLSMKPY